MLLNFFVECNPIVTRQSADELGLAPGQQVTVLIKATDVMISTGDDFA
jgi:molybdopterin-binding protein